MKEFKNRGNQSKIDPKTKIEPYYLTNSLTQYDEPGEEGAPSKLSDEKVVQAKRETDFNEK